MSNRAHPRRGVPLAKPVEQPGVMRRALRFMSWFLGPAQGRDRFPRRGSATARMNAAVRAGFFGSRRR
jgi:hypothetical protein